MISQNCSSALDSDHKIGHANTDQVFFDSMESYGTKQKSDVHVYLVAISIFIPMYRSPEKGSLPLDPPLESCNGQDIRPSRQQCI